jgi:hypothetical protein
MASGRGNFSFIRVRFSIYRGLSKSTRKLAGHKPYERVYPNELTAGLDLVAHEIIDISRDSATRLLRR